MSEVCLRIEEWVCGSDRQTWVSVGQTDMGVLGSDGHADKMEANVPTQLRNNSDSAQSARIKGLEYRYDCLQSTIGLSTETPMEEIGEGLKEHLQIAMC